MLQLSLTEHETTSLSSKELTIATTASAQFGVLVYLAGSPSTGWGITNHILP